MDLLTWAIIALIISLIAGAFGFAASSAALGCTPKAGKGAACNR